MKRIFTAIKINPNDKSLQIYNELKSACRNDKINWVEPHNLHITLKFFGETEENKIPDIVSALLEIAKHHTGFSFYLKDVGIFGSHYKPKVIWFGVDRMGELKALANDVLNGMGDLGFERDRQNFVPHLTIGRIKFTDNKRLFQETIEKYKSVDIQKQTINQFFLIESFLGSQGPVYKILESFQLQ
ncbi:MAG: RNA 2',3'-cyclic phosphodiesterase [Bacteroidales bacterium]|nr:RNA 2',3'-cyclic phosphodiesterase [Bacteroidales bacterium]